MSTVESKTTRRVRLSRIKPGEPETLATPHCITNISTHKKAIWASRPDARDGIRTQELLRDQALNLTPLTWLGYPRACIDYVQTLIKVREIEDYAFLGT